MVIRPRPLGVVPCLATAIAIALSGCPESGEPGPTPTPAPTPDPVPAPFVEEHPGSLTLLSDDDVAALVNEGTSVITGDLIVGPDVSAVDLPALQRLSGVLRMDSAAALTTVNLPRLSLCGGISLVNTDLLATMGLPALVFVDGDVTVLDNENLVDLAGLSTVVRVEGDLIIERNASLTALARLGRIESIEGRFIVRGNPLLSDLSVGSLSNVGGDLVVEENDSLESPAGLGGLESVGGDLVIEENDALASTDELGSLSNVGGDLVVDSNDNLSDVEGLGQVASVGGDLVVEGNEALESLDGLTMDSVGGAVSVRDNDAVTDLDGVDLGTIDGDVVIAGNDSLTDIASLQQTANVGGALRLDENTTLDTDDALRLLQLLVDLGIVASGQASVNGVVVFARTAIVRFAVFSPDPGERIVRGDEQILSVDLAVTLGDPIVTWSATPVDDQDDPTGPDVPLGTGSVIRIDSSILPQGRVRVRASLVVNDLTAVRDVVVFAEDLNFAPIISPIARQAGVAVPSVQAGAPLTATATENQPLLLRGTVFHPVDGDLSTLITWSVDGIPLFSGAAFDVSFLRARVEPYAIVASATDRQGRSQEAALNLTVAPLVFSASFIAPVLTGIPEGNAALAPPYLERVPVVVDIAHPWQQAFGLAAVNIVDESGAIIANAPGLPAGAGRFRVETSTTRLAPGPHTLRVEVLDLLGNVAAQSTSVAVQEVVFSATLEQPFAGQVLEEGQQLPARVNASHSLADTGFLDVADFEVRYLSSRGGLLFDDAGNGVFDVGETVALVVPQTGTQTISVEVQDGLGRVARDSRNITSRSRNVSATFVSPVAESVILPGVPVTFQAIVTEDLGAGSLLTWRIDGVEVPATFDDYGTVAANLARQDLFLGAFAVGAGNFNSPLFAPGRHTVELFVRTPEFDGICRDVPNKAFCLRSSFEVVDLDGLDLCPSTTARTLTAASPPETWTGTRRLNCDVTINGGQVIVTPGARILVNADRSITFNAGRLIIGDANAADEVLFEVPGSVSRSGWRGITGTFPSAGLMELIVGNTRIRNANFAFNMGGFQGTTVAEQRYELRRVTFERGGRPWFGACPTVVDDVTVRDADDTIFESSGGEFCDRDREWRRFTVLDASTTVADLAGPGNLTISGAVVERVEGDAFRKSGFDGGLLTIVGARFADVSGAALDVPQCGNARLSRSTAVRVGALVDAPSASCSRSGPLRVDGNHQRDSAVGIQRAGNLAIEAHGNAFFNVAEVFAHTGTSAEATTIAAEGNFLGARNDAGSAAGVLARAPAGTLPNLPTVTDLNDDPRLTSAVHADPPLITASATAAASPTTFIRRPAQRERYDQCVPVDLRSVDGDVEFAPASEGDDDVIAPSPGFAARCKLFVLPAGSALTLNPSDPARSRVEAQGGCLAVDLPAGEHALAAQCVHNDSVVDRHVARFRVDHEVVSGRLGPGLTTWSGTMTLAGDITVPQDASLVIEPGTVVRMLGIDSLREALVIDNLNNGTFTDDTAGRLNRGFGQRSGIDIYVEGELFAVGTPTEPIRFAPSEGVPTFEGIWGGIRVHQSARAELRHIVATGAFHFLHGEYTPADATLAPTLLLTDAVIEDVHAAVHGVCPEVMDRVTLRRSEYLVREGACRDSLTWSDLELEDVGGTIGDSGVVSIRDYNGGAAATISLTIEGADVRRSGLATPVFLETFDSTRVSVLTIRDSVFEGMRTVITARPTAGTARTEILLENVSVNRGAEVLNLIRAHDRVLVRGGAYNDVVQFFREDDEREARDIDVEGARFSQMAIGLNLGTSSLGSRSVRIRRSLFEEVATAIRMSVITTTTVIDAQENHFVDVTEALRLKDQAASRVVDTDLSGSFFANAAGVALGTAAIEASIIDTQVDRGDDFKGRTRYAPVAVAPFLSFP